MKKFDTMNLCVAANGAPCGDAGAAAGKRSLWSPLPQFLTHLFDTLYSWQGRASQRRRLRELEPRLLADMGMTRADAEEEIAKPFWKK